MKSVLSAVAVLFFVSCFSAQVARAQSVTLSNTYTNSQVILPGFEFHWAINTPTNTTLSFALVTPFTGGKGWVSLGIGEPNSGSMPGADMVVVEFDASIATEPTVGDYHAEDFTTPTKDCVGEDEWKLSAFNVNSTHGAFELTRPLTVSDSQNDRSIKLGLHPIKLLFAYGSTATMSYHGTVNRALESVYLVPPFSPQIRLRDLDSVKAASTTHVSTWAADNYPIKTIETEYYHVPCTIAPALNASGAEPFIIGFEPFATPGSEPHLHHMVVFAYANADCTGDARALLGLASKTTPVMMPEGVGLKLSDFKSFDVQIHYDNPSGVAGIVDSSGVRALYSYEPVEQQAASMVVGDPLVQTATKVEPGFSSYHYNCPSYCTSMWPHEITVFTEFMHAHQLGYRMNYTVADSAGTVKRTSTSDFYQFELQANEYVEPFTLAAGDSISTTCSYHNKGSSSISFGIDSDEEMCMTYFLYYPAMSELTARACGYIVCGDDPKINEVGSKWDFPTTFGRCNLPATETPVTPSPSSGGTRSRAAVPATVAITIVTSMLFSIFFL